MVEEEIELKNGKVEEEESTRRKRCNWGICSVWNGWEGIRTKCCLNFVRWNCGQYFAR